MLACDVADTESVRDAVATFADLAGGIDLLVVNAGITHYGPYRRQSLEDQLQMSEVNWHGTLRTVHFGLPHLLDRANGHVVVVSSGAALRSFPWAAVYGGTKAAQRMFAEALRHELSGTGVSLTTVYPGEIATHLHDHEKDRMPDWYRGGPGAASADALAAKVLAAVEADSRAVWFPADRPAARRAAQHRLARRRRAAAPAARRDRGAAARTSRAAAGAASSPAPPPSRRRRSSTSSTITRAAGESGASRRVTKAIVIMIGSANGTQPIRCDMPPAAGDEQAALEDRVADAGGDEVEHGRDGLDVDDRARASRPRAAPARRCWRRVGSWSR